MSNLSPVVPLTLHDETGLRGLARGSRPGASQMRSAPVLPPEPGDCPFCPGGSAMLEPARATVDRADGTWGARSIPNKFPMVDGPRGQHEVLILSRVHTGHLLDPSADMLCGLQLVQQRMRHARENGLHGVAFANYGRLSGATQPHPHSQLLILDQPSPALAAEQTRLQEPTCVICCADASTIVFTDEVFAVHAVAAPRRSHELIVAPREHCALYDRADPATLAQLRRALGRVGELTQRAFGPHAYNLLWHQSGHADDDFHWHMHVVPRLGIPSVLELGELPLSEGDGTQTAALLRAHLR